MFFRFVKIEAYFKGNKNINLWTEDQIFKRKWTRDKNHHTIDEATKAKLKERQWKFDPKTTYEKT